MSDERGPLAAEQQFFSSLIAGDVKTLDRVLGDDFLLIDVTTGSEIPRSDLLGVIRSGQLKFASIEQIGSRLRLYGTTAVITGRTQMSGQFGKMPFATSSRYTHVYVKGQDHWRLVSAQGTQIKAG
jgi:ketosteroid isomerase-like protein